MKKFLSIIALGLVCLVQGCREEIKPEAVALQTAKAYYDQLMQGDYAAFVAGFDYKDSIHPSYREQLEVGMKQYIAYQRSLHQGIDSVVALRATVDTIKTSANKPLLDGRGDAVLSAKAFLSLCFSDSVKEEILVPMVRKEGIWLMK